MEFHEFFFDLFEFTSFFVCEGVLTLRDFYVSCKVNITLLSESGFQCEIIKTFSNIFSMHTLHHLMHIGLLVPLEEETRMSFCVVSICELTSVCVPFLWKCVLEICTSGCFNSCFPPLLYS